LHFLIKQLEPGSGSPETFIAGEFTPRMVLAPLSPKQ
jgi:hypothetical protein